MKMFKRNKTLKGSGSQAAATPLPTVPDAAEAPDSQELGKHPLRKDSEDFKGLEREDSQERKGGMSGFGALRAATKKASRIQVGAFALKNNLAEKVGPTGLPPLDRQEVPTDKPEGATDKPAEKTTDKPAAPAPVGGLATKGKGLFGKLGGAKAAVQLEATDDKAKDAKDGAAQPSGGGGLMGGSRLRGFIMSKGKEKDAVQSQADSNIKGITMLPNAIELPDPVALEGDMGTADIDNSSKTTVFKGGSDFERGKEGAIRLIMKNFNVEDKEAYDGY